MKKGKKSEIDINEIDQLKLFDLILTHLPGHLYWKNKEGVLLGCNEEQARSAGLSSRTEIAGKTDYDLPWKEQADSLRKIDLDILKTGKPITAEEISVLSNGKKAIFLSKKVPLFDDNNQSNGILGISIDITEKKESEKEKLWQKLSQKADILSIITNEFRTLFQVIELNLTDLIDEKHLNAKQARIIEMIREACDQKNILLTRASDFSKLETGTLTIEPEIFDLIPLLEDLLLQKYRNLPEAVDLYLQKDKSILKYFIRADYVHFKSILSVALDQAIERTKEGHILVELLESNADKILTVRISDTSDGYSADSLKKMFSEAAYENSLWGSSIDLTYSKKFMEAMSGSYELKSKEWEGVSVQINIPMKQAISEVPTTKNKTRKKLYIFLENKIATKSLETLLPGFDCVLTHNMKALKNISTADNALIIIDGKLLESEEILVTLKSKNLHVIALNRKNANTIKSAFEKSSLSVLTKPLLPNSLPHQLSEILKRKRILIIEDDPFLRKTIAMVLGAQGFQIDQAKNHPEAIEKASPVYDCILMDIGLPQISGIEIARELKQMFGKVCPPMLAFTGLTGTHDLDDVHSCGFFDRVMIKGRIKLQDIAQQINDVIAESKGTITR